MAKYDFDLLVVGGGSGGVRAARIAAGHGARVAIAEEYRYGGTCVIRGCIPKKLLVYAAQFGETFVDAAGFGWHVGPPQFSWPALIAAKDGEIGRLEAVYRKLLGDSGVRVMDGRARVVDPHTVSVGDRRFSADILLIATGAQPVKPPVPGSELCITSNEAFQLPRLPPRVAILGGAFVACEFAGIFSGLGAAVTQIHRGPNLLRGFDHDVGRHLAEEMGKKGVRVWLDAAVSRIERHGAGLAVHCADGRSVAADIVLAATGRAPATQDLGLEAAGVALAPGGAVGVDDWSRSSVANIYAVGDVTNRVNLTPVAIREGHAFADTVFGRRSTKPDHANVPHAVFSRPNVGAVGLSESAARARFGAVDVYRSVFTPLMHTLSRRPEKTLMKLVADAATDRVVGCHMVGPDAGEIVQGLAVALKCGATKAAFDATIGIHPTAAEEFVTMRQKVLPAVAAE